MFFDGNNNNNNSNNSGKYFEDFSSQSQLSPRVRRHLFAVYSHLATTALLTLVACWMQINGVIRGGGILPAVGGIGALWFLRSVRNQTLRQLMLYAFGFLEGMSLSPLVSNLYYIEPQVLLSSILSTFFIFAGFTATALYAPRRSFLYLGGIVSAGMVILLVASFLNTFISGSSIVDNAILYIGLLIFAFLITFDTQLIVERVESERLSVDAVYDAANMLINIMAILRRLMVIMSTSSDYNQRDRNKKRRNNSDKPPDSQRPYFY